MLEVKDLSCGYEDKILENISFTGNRGDIICILGANGSGKSTLIKTLVGLLQPKGGRVLLDGENIKNWSWKKRAQNISYIPQYFSSTFQYRVIDIVLMARTCWLSYGDQPGKKDLAIAETAMESLGIYHLKDRIYSNLSGGERQLVKISQALAQETRILVMDEPTNNLDFKNQATMMKFLKECAKTGLLILMVTHFPDQALRYGTKALLLKDGEGKLVARPKENLKSKDLQNLYDMEIGLYEINVANKLQKVCLENSLTIIS